MMVGMVIDGYEIDPLRVTHDRECSQPARLKRIDLSLEFATAVLTQDWRSDTIAECTSGLPDGAICIGGLICGRTISLIYYHESFQSIMVGEAIPTLAVQYHIEETNQDDNAR